MSESLPLDLPAGLSRLASLDRLRVVRGGAGPGQYAVRGPDGGPLLEARERPWGLAGLAGLLAGKDRDLRIDVFDLSGEKVMEMSRPFSLGGDAARVMLGGGAGGGASGWAGELRRELTFFRPVLALREQGRLVARLKGPMDTSGDCDFKVYSEAKKQMGVISARRGGAARQFELRLPRDAPVPHKAALLAACFLIDFLYFEQ